MPEYSVRPVLGIGEVIQGTDLADLVLAGEPRDGDIVLVTSKIVSKSEGMVRQLDREVAIRSEATRIVARRGATLITENQLGLTMAASGVDASNVDPGKVLLLPRDPDASASAIRRSLPVNVAVIISDTAGRPWRNGQTDLAIGVAGMAPLKSFAGEDDSYGNPLAVTAPALADELASAAELATGKLGQAPIAIVRGLAELVLAPGEDGPGARALIRPRSEDLFALGAREAVMSVLTNSQLDCFGAPATPVELIEALSRVGMTSMESGSEVQVTATTDQASAIIELVARSHAWEILDDSLDARSGPLRLAPYTPSP